MTDDTTRRYNEGEILSGVHRLRRRIPNEKVRIVEEMYLPGMSVSMFPANMASAAIRSSRGDA